VTRSERCRSRSRRDIAPPPVDCLQAWHQRACDTSGFAVHRPLSLVLPEQPPPRPSPGPRQGVRPRTRRWAPLGSRSARRTAAGAVRRRRRTARRGPAHLPDHGRRPSGQQEARSGQRPEPDAEFDYTAGEGAGSLEFRSAATMEGHSVRCAAPSPSESRPARDLPASWFRVGTAPGLGGWRCRRTCTPT
jgi:hypothetical protein